MGKLVQTVPFLFAFCVLFFVPTQSFGYDACDASDYENAFVPCTAGGFDYDTYITFEISSVPFTIFSSSTRIVWDTTHATDTFPYIENTFNDGNNWSWCQYQGGTAYSCSGSGGYYLPFLAQGGVGLPFTYGNELEWFLYAVGTSTPEFDTGCTVNAIGEVICGIYPAVDLGFSTVGTSTRTRDYRKVEFFVQNLDGVQIQPDTLYSRADFYEFENYIYPDTFSFSFLLPAVNEFKVIACDVPSLTSYALEGFYGDTFLCTTMYVFNGYTQEEAVALANSLGIYGSSGGITTVSSVDIAKEYSCDDLGITDVLPAIKCGFLWAFYPSKSSVQNIESATDKMLSIYPIGYAKIIYTNLSEAVSSSSTAVFDKDIDVGNWFGKTGRATVTIDVATLTSSSSIGWVQPIIEKIELFFWLVFFAWLIWWGLTRKL